MSIKPLDLQVNMNSQVNLSQQEAKRVASLNNQQKINNVKSQKAGNLVRESVTESKQSEDSANLDNDHNLYAEQVTVQEASHREQTYTRAGQEKLRASQNTEKTDPIAGRPPRSNSIDLLA